MKLHASPPNQSWRRKVVTPPRIAIAVLAAVALLQGAPAVRAQIYTLQVPDTQPWTDTGIDVSAGSLLGITASGVVRYGYDSVSVTDANGVNSDGVKFFSTAILPKTIVVSLIGKIGGTTAVGTGTLLPEGVPGNGPGFVGTSYSEQAPESGRLFLGFNDQYYPDNSGAFSVTVTIVPEPAVFALVALGGLAFLVRGKTLLARRSPRPQ
jgi:hypothetical protein